MKDLFGKEVDPTTYMNPHKSNRNKDGSYKTNPLLSVHGPGPDNKRCKHCAFFYTKYFSKKYFKCELRKYTKSPNTDHRANWLTCGRFEAKVDNM